MFSAAQFARMRPGACFINTARESLVDEPALRDALDAGHARRARRSTCWSGRPPDPAIRC